mgnify:CR=1 FL=1
MINRLQTIVNYQSRMNNVHKNQNTQFNKWVSKNKEDLEILYECFVTNSKHFLNVLPDDFSGYPMFRHFCKFIFQQTSTELTCKHMSNLV